jgi:hypothetical protein
MRVFQCGPACQSPLDAQNRTGIVGKPRLVTRVSGLLSVRRIDHRRLDEALTNRWAHRKGSVGERGILLAQSVLLVTLSLDW